MANALLQYRNTTVQGVGYSPAHMLFGRPLKDALPSHPDSLGWDATTRNYGEKYGMAPMSKYWTHILAGRELGASIKLAQNIECYDEHSKPLTSPESRGKLSFALGQDRSCGGATRAWPIRGQI